MKRLAAVYIAGLLSLASPLSYAAPKSGEPLDVKTIELANYAKAFIGQGNITVEVAPYKMDGKSGAILLFKGVEGPWDGKAINHHVQPSAYGGSDYATTYNGTEWTTINARKDDEGKMKYLLSLPGVDEQIWLAPSDGAAQLTTPKAIVDEYQKQQGKKGASK